VKEGKEARKILHVHNAVHGTGNTKTAVKEMSKLFLYVRFHCLTCHHMWWCMKHQKRA